MQLAFGPACGGSDNRCPFVPPATKVGSESRLSDILSQMMSTSRSKTDYKVKWNKIIFGPPIDLSTSSTHLILTLTLTFSFADVSKNSTPNWSANCLPRSNDITLSSSMSHLLPTKITCALSHEYVLICVTLLDDCKNCRRKKEKEKWKCIRRPFYNSSVYLCSLTSLVRNWNFLHLWYRTLIWNP